MLALTCTRVSLTTTVSTQTSAITTNAPEVTKTRLTPPKRPQPLNVGPFLKTGILPCVKQPTQTKSWDEVFEPRPVPKESDLDVRRAAPVFVDNPIGERYEFKGKLGHGTYGTVYHGVDKETGKQVAIKEIKKGEGCCVLSDCKIKQEINVLDDLKGCDSVVQIYGSYTSEDTMYIVTELCKGGDLEGYLETNGQMTEKQMSLVASEALKMLAECHSKNIVHGDVKAANFVIANVVEQHMFGYGANQLPSGWLKGIDFGTSQYTGRGRCSNKVGTPTHWAPEVLAGAYHTEADMWSLGVMLYRLMTGMLPFWDKHQEAMLKSEQDIINGVMHTRPDFDSEPWCHVSPECVDFLKGLLDINYATRMTAESAMTHPFMTRHLKKDRRMGLGPFEQIMLPSTASEALPAVL